VTDDDTTDVERSKPWGVGRQAAMAYLKTATRTDNAAVRNWLRRLAADLILPRRDDGAQGRSRPRDFS
jgi:hypothetical protein